MLQAVWLIALVVQKVSLSSSTLIRLRHLLQQEKESGSESDSGMTSQKIYNSGWIDKVRMVV